MMQLKQIPVVEASVENSILPAVLLQQLQQVRIAQRWSLPTQCELVFTGCDAPDVLQLGAMLRLRLGSDTGHLFEGRITALQHARTLSEGATTRVVAYDRLQALRDRQPVRDFPELSSREIIQKLLRAVGLHLDMPVSGPLWHRITQQGESDFALLERIARHTGVRFFLRGDTVGITGRHGAGEVLSLPEADFRRLEIERSGLQWPAEVTVGGWNARRADHCVQKSAATAAQMSRHERRYLNRQIETREQAESIGQARLAELQANACRLRGQVEGCSDLYPGRPVVIDAASNAFAGTHVLSEVIHRVDARSGYLCEIDSAWGPPEPSPRAPATTVAHVIAVDDPERLGRVRVSLDCFEGMASDWLQVVLPGLGASKGLCALPDVGDRVIVLLPEADPAQGLVLGAVFGETIPDDAGVQGRRVARYSLRTAAGQHLTLQDDAHRVTLAHRNGLSLELTEDSVRLSGPGASRLEMNSKGTWLFSDGDLHLTAPGNRVIISGAAIDLDKA